MISVRSIALQGLVAAGALAIAVQGMTPVVDETQPIAEMVGSGDNAVASVPVRLEQSDLLTIILACLDIIDPP